MGKKQSYLETRILVFILVLGVLLLFSIILHTVDARSLLFSVVFPIVLLVLFLFLIVLFYYQCIVPYKRNKHIWQLFATGYTLNTIADQQVPLNKEMLIVNEALRNLLNTDQLMNASKRQAQFLALQNQINPHFLYNTLEGIRSEALLAGLDSVATMTEALSTFFRYTISNVENLVTLEQELENTKNYFFIQQFRFGNRLKLNIIFDDEDTQQLLGYRIPKLTLQPIVENCIVHGLECKVGEGNLLISVEESQSRLLITVRDDGVGMSGEMLEKIQKHLSRRSIEYVKREEHEGGIALVNVNNRIKLLFGEQYGLTVTSEIGVGTDVMIMLPKSKEKEV